MSSSKKSTASKKTTKATRKATLPESQKIGTDETKLSDDASDMPETHLSHAIAATVNRVGTSAKRGGAVSKVVKAPKSKEPKEKKSREVTRSSRMADLLLECKHTDAEIYETLVKEFGVQFKKMQIAVLRQAINGRGAYKAKKEASGIAVIPNFARDEYGKLVQKVRGEKKEKPAAVAKSTLSRITSALPKE